MASLHVWRRLFHPACSIPVHLLSYLPSYLPALARLDHREEHGLGDPALRALLLAGNDHQNLKGALMELCRGPS